MSHVFTETSHSLPCEFSLFTSSFLLCKLKRLWFRIPVRKQPNLETELRSFTQMALQRALKMEIPSRQG
jgi:hypothetical protein